MYKRILSILLVVLVLLASASGIILAQASWAYKFPTIIQDTSATTRTYLPVDLGYSGQALIDAGYITSSGLATNMQDGATNRKYMLSTTKALTVVPNLPANGQITHDLYTGSYSAPGVPTQTVFPVIVGHNGSVTTADAPALEPANNVSIVHNGGVDTTAGNNKFLFRKAGAISTYADPVTSGTVNARIGGDQVIVGGGPDEIAASSTEYSVLMGSGDFNATRNLIEQCMPTAGVISQLYIRMSAAPAAGTAIFTLMKNAAAQALTVTITAGGATTGSDLTHAVSFVAGDTVSLRYVTSGASGTPKVAWSTTWSPTIANESIFLMQMGTTIANATYGIPQGSLGLGSAATADQNGVMPTAGTFSKLYVNLSADPGVAPDAYAFTLRKNGADQALTTTIVANDTAGHDTVNTVSFVAGDLINIKIDPAATTPTVAPKAAIGMVFTPTISGESVMMGGTASVAPSLVATNWNTISGANASGAFSGWSATESDRYQLTQKTVISKLYVKLKTAPGAGTSFTFNVREAGGATGLTVPISDTATTGSDLTHTYTSANGAVTDMESVPVGPPVSPVSLHWGLVSSVPATVSVAGITPTAGEKTVTTRAATSNVLHFDGTANSNVDCGAIYSAVPKLWVSYWFKLDNNWIAGMGVKYLGGKCPAGTDEWLFALTNGGQLTFYYTKGGVNKFSISSVQTSWVAGTWYHAICSISSVNGARLRINGGVAVTDADTTVLFAGGNLVLGDYVVGGALGFTGELANVTMGTDDLTPAEETALYAGTIPSDATDIWRVNEGTGNTVYSTGTAGNNGTKGAAALWQTSDRPLGEDNPQWATGNVLHFDGTAGTSLIDCGAIYNGQANFWVSLWFKLDAIHQNGSAIKTLFSKDDGGANFLSLLLDTNGLVTFRMRVGGVDNFIVTTLQDVWQPNIWYNVIAETNTVRLIVNNGAPRTNVSVSALPGVGNVYIGGSALFTEYIGHIQNVIVGTDDLTPAEETALYNGTAPGDETDYWYLDEGTGLVANSYGSAANPGTIGAACAWQTATYTAGQTGRLCDFTLQVDSTLPTTSIRVGDNLESAGASAGVPDTDAQWQWMQGDVSSYANYITETTVAGEVLRYQPNTMLAGTNYTTGTATFTITSSAVTGGGTAWTTDMVGSTIKSNATGKWYTIVSVTDATNLVITPVYATATEAGVAYTITTTILPDRDALGGLTDGSIAWGSNTGITIVYDAMTSYESTTSSVSTTGGFTMPTVPAPSNWWAIFVSAPAPTQTATFTQGSTTVNGFGTAWTTADMVGGGIQSTATGVWYVVTGVTNPTTLTISKVYATATEVGVFFTTATAKLPMLETFLNVASMPIGGGAGIPVQTLYLLPIWGLAFAMLFVVTRRTRSLFMGIIAMVIILFIGSEMTVIPKWQPFMLMVLDFGVIFIQRQMGY